MSQSEPKVFDKVFVRNVTEEDRIQISFKYSNSILGIPGEKLFNFNRLKTEELEKSLVRISGNVSKEVNKKFTKKQKKTTKKENSPDGAISNNQTEDAKDEVPDDMPSEENLLPISLHRVNNVEFEGSVFNDEAWRGANYMKLGDHQYCVEFNSPTLKQVILPQVIMAGYAIVPKLFVEFANVEESKFKWFVEKQAKDENNDSSNAKKFKINHSKSGDKLKPQDWSLASQEFKFTPSDEHKNCFIKFSCLPQDGARVGEEVSFISKCRVTDGPKDCPFEKRHKFTEQMCGNDSFRVVCYNILADLYADSDYSRNYLFPYCPPHFLTIDYRKHLIIKELIGFNADVICLQEVDRKVFEDHLLPLLKHHSFEGLLKVKMGEVAEGCATFYRSSKFKHIESYDIGLNEFLSTDESVEGVRGVLDGNEVMKAKMVDRSSVLQVTLLENTSNPGRHLLIGTVHLYFHPRAAHIRLIQTHLCIRYLQKMLQELKEEKNIHPEVVYCGDFNAYSGSGVHEYLTEKLIPPTHADWFTGGKEEYLPGLKLRHDLDLVNLSGYPAYTNYVGGFNACLDYIYASTSLQPIRIIPLPSHADVTKNTALPNEFFPSDHIAIGCDVAWPSSQS